MARRMAPWSLARSTLSLSPPSMLIPDGKTQVTIEYAQKKDGSVEPRKTHTVVISTHYAEPSKVVRTKECAGYSGPEMIVPSTVGHEQGDQREGCGEDLVRDQVEERCNCFDFVQPPSSSLVDPRATLASPAVSLKRNWRVLAI